jgi:hypothetical protein
LKVGLVLAGNKLILFKLILFYTVTHHLTLLLSSRYRTLTPHLTLQLELLQLLLVLGHEHLEPLLQVPVCMGRRLREVKIKDTETRTTANIL